MSKEFDPIQPEDFDRIEAEAEEVLRLFKIAYVAVRRAESTMTESPTLPRAPKDFVLESLKGDMKRTRGIKEAVLLARTFSDRLTEIDELDEELDMIPDEPKIDESEFSRFLADLPTTADNDER